jgi:Leucine-rich repeat (LRR) protein
MAVLVMATFPHYAQATHIAFNLYRLSGELGVLAEMASLAKLVINDNPIPNLPEAIGAQQPHLNEVLADCCQLKSIPSALSSAPRLLKLSCRSNGLQLVGANLLKGALLQGISGLMTLPEFYCL